MMLTSESNQLLIERIRAGESAAWDELIARLRGAFDRVHREPHAEPRRRRRSGSGDVYRLLDQPNKRRPLESYLFSIACAELTDHLRREGRRPTLPLMPDAKSGSDWEPAGPDRPASSIARSGERRRLEEDALVEVLCEQIEHWRGQKQWDKIKAAELLFVRGWANKEVADRLEISEQTVANYKFEFLAKLAAIRRHGLPEEVFPELYES